MLEPNKSPKACFIYFVGCAVSLFNCTRETIQDIFPDKDYCIIDRYKREEDYHEISLQIDMYGVTLVCYFDDNDRCNSCFVYFSNTENTGLYTDICHNLFEYSETAHLWVMYSGYVKYNEENGRGCFAFFSI